MHNYSEGEGLLETTDSAAAPQGAAAPRGGRRNRWIAGSVAAATLLAAGGLAAWATGLFASGESHGVSSGLTKYDLQVSDGVSDFVDSTREEPLMLTSASSAGDLIREGMTWEVVVRNNGTSTGELFFVICDPSSAKVKYRIAPGKDEIYPDLFTQLKFTVSDEQGNVVIDDVSLGADADNEPNGDGTLRGAITRVLEAGGGEATFTVKAAFDFDANDLTRTKLAAYNGVDTDFGIRIEGESF